MIHHTPMSAAAVHPSGWVKLPSGAEITRLPLVDLEHSLRPRGDTPDKLFARLNYGEALEVVDGLGAKLPSPEVIEELREVGLQLIPFLGTPVAETGIYHSRLHDNDVKRQLEALRWDGEQAVCGAGKHWISGARPDYSRLMGWDKDGPGPGRVRWQPPQHAHKYRRHHDDGTTTLAELLRRLLRLWQNALFSLGERSSAWMGDQSVRNVHTIPGPANDARILGYSEHCRRGGTFLGVSAGGTPLWDGGVPLSLFRDEDPWCAATGSEALRLALLPGEAPPHGLRVSVRELVEDARVSETLRVVGDGYVPVPGDLAIMARAGETPLHGGRGHVRRVLLVDGPQYNGIGGNESRRIQVDTHPLSEAKAWIAYPRKVAA